MIESQIQYTLEEIKLARRERLKAVEVRRAAQDAFNRELSARMAKTVWATGGCTSWYMTAAGKNTTLWPGFTYEFRQRTLRFDRENYVLSQIGEARAEPPQSVESGRAALAVP
jgi:cyclohexanone monooxygenase